MTAEELLPNPVCLFVQRDGRIWLLASNWSVECEGHKLGAIIATYDAAAVTGSDVGCDLRKAFKGYAMLVSDSDGPPDPFEIISKGKVNKFIRGSMSVMIEWDEENSKFHIQGGYARTGAGHLNDARVTSVSTKASDRDLGDAILREFERTRRREGLE